MTDPTTGLEARRPETRSSDATLANVAPLLELAAQIAGTPFVPKNLQEAALPDNKPKGATPAVEDVAAVAAAAMLTGLELGLGPMTSLSKIYIVDGRPGIAAELMRAIVLQAGHEIWLDSSSSKSVTLGGRRKGSKKETVITWTMDDAETAGLAKKFNWRSYPRAMLTARATGELCRLLFADVLAGISYTKEEIEDGFELDEDATASVPALEETLPPRPDDVDPAPPPTTTRRAEDVEPASTDVTRPGESDTSASTDVTRPGESDTSAPPARAPEPAAPPPLPGEEGIPADEPLEGRDPVGTGEHEAGDTVAPDGAEGPRLTAPQALAIRANDLGLDDDARHGLYAAITEGRTSSGNDLDREEIEAAFEVLQQIDEETATLDLIDGRWTVSVSGSTVFQSPPTETPVEASEADQGQSSGEPENATDPPRRAESGPSEPSDEVPGSEKDWKAFLRSHGAKVADGLRAAAVIAGGRGVPPKEVPRTLAELAQNPDLSEATAAYIIEENQ